MAKYLRQVIELLAKRDFVDIDTIIDALRDKYPELILNDIKQKSIINYSKLENYSKKGYFIFTENGKNYIAINNLNTLMKALKYLDSDKIKLIKNRDFLFLLQREFDHLNLIRSKYYLDFIHKGSTAKNVSYIKVISISGTVFLIIFFKFITAFHIINCTLYLIQNSFKLFLFKRTIFAKDILLKNHVKWQKLPIYTILVPLYKEIEKLKFIIESVTNLIYPKNKLDIKLIVESDDEKICNIINTLELPNYIEVIKVPFSFPRTKPKALNFAMPYCKGEYLVIYDAEDLPDQNQLLIALTTFDSLPPEYACLQAKINFYNSEENLLAKHMSIEYSLWFEFLLKGLSLLELPVPLGGTSNHIKIEALKKIGCWDAYNVTEDADLGVRLYLNGYKTQIIDSYTLEESPIGLKNWIKQRARWTKGFLQTFLVFLHQTTNAKIKFLALFSICIFIGLTPYIFFVVPWLLLGIHTNTDLLINYLWLVNSFFALSYSYANALYILLRKHKTLLKFRRIDYISAITYPLYFILHSIASYIAIWEIIISPFSWYKTNHGVSNKYSNSTHTSKIK